MKIWTIGHSNHPIGKFLALLDSQGIQRLVDVRSAPYSRYVPHFDKDALSFELARHSVEYVYAGKYLGGRPQDEDCYKSHKIADEGVDYLHLVNYPAVMAKPWFQTGIQRLMELAAELPTAVMCSEEDPAACHRHHLISKYLLREYPEIEIVHIRGDGNLVNARSILASVDQEDAQQLSLF